MTFLPLRPPARRAKMTAMHTNKLRRVRQACWAVAILLLARPPALAQSGNGNGNSNGSGAGGEIDACGILVRDGNCVLFDGGGGRYVLSDYGDFTVGDPVRVVGTIDENCITICNTADGCIRGAIVYDPAVLPCGTPVSVPFDPCSGLSAGLMMLTIAGLAAVRRRP